MVITCSNCNQKIEVDDNIADGQHVRCPYCDITFGYSAHRMQCPNCKGEVILPDGIEVGQHIRCPYCNEKFSYSGMRSPTGAELLNSECANRRREEGKVHNVNPQGNELFWYCTQKGIKWCRGLSKSKRRLLIACAIIASCVVVGPCKRDSVPQAGSTKEVLAKIKNMVGRQYESKKAWYKHQLDYNGLREVYFNDRDGVAVLSLYGDGGQKVDITYMYEHGFIEYSRSIPKGFAQELINARMFIENYEMERDRPEEFLARKKAETPTTEILDKPSDEDITVKRHKTLIVKSKVTGAITIDSKAVLILDGISTKSIFVSNGGKLVLNGSATGNINNKGETIVNGTVGGTMYNDGELEIHGTVSGTITSYNRSCKVDPKAKITGSLNYYR